MRKQLTQTNPLHTPLEDHAMRGGLPTLPLSLSAEDSAVGEASLNVATLPLSEPTRLFELDGAAWLDAIVLVLNDMWHMPQANYVKDELAADWPGLSSAPPAASQLKALAPLREQVRDLLLDDTGKPGSTAKQG